MTLSKEVEKKLREHMQSGTPFMIAQDGFALIVKKGASGRESGYSFALDEPASSRRFEAESDSIRDLFTDIRKAVKDWGTAATSYAPAKSPRKGKATSKSGDKQAKVGPIFGIGIRAAVQWMSQQGMDRRQIAAAVEAAMGQPLPLNTRSTINTASSQAKNPKYRIEVDMPAETGIKLLAFAH